MASLIHPSMASVKLTPARPNFWTSWLDPLIVQPVHICFRLCQGFSFSPTPKTALETRVRGELHRWIRAFLTNQLQQVVYNGCPSAWAKVISGVPQGSIVGPLLFLVYVY